MKRLLFTWRGVLITLSVIALLPSVSSAQGTITFEGPPLQRPGSGKVMQLYQEQGVWFVPIFGSDGFVRTWAGDPRDPDNGSLAYLQATSGDSLEFGLDDNSLFNLVSVDLAEYSTVVPQARTVHFIGYRQDGSTVDTVITTDGIFDGTGPLADFQTFYFGPEFSGLWYVGIPTSGWSLDNLVISIPEPGTGAFVTTVVLLLCLRAFGRKSRCL